MPLIHQIEIASILNHRRISPWRPDWRYQRFLLGGLHTAMNIPNGRGKSTMVAVILGMLAWHPKCLKEVRTNHCAPPDYPFFTHIRIEITNRNVEQKDLLVDLTGPNDGERMVFGIYGNAGENNEFKFYAYRGTFDDCPIGRRHGNRVSLVGNDEFLSTLQRQEGRFPSSRKEEQVGEWRRFVAEHFDMSSIQQQLKYQLEKGAEGSSHYFEVKAKGQNYSAELFYKHLAPELLTDVMGGLGEEDEKGIEDTIHEKARGVILANRRTRQTATELEAAKEVLDVFESLNGFGIRMADALQEVGKHKEALSLEMAALSQVLEINPVVGIPRPPAPEHPAFYGHFVLQDGAWWLTDRGIGAIAGDEAKRINERADRNRISSQPIKASQLIDFACDLSPHYSSGNTPGQRGRLYSTTAAADLIRASNSFAPPWTKETALAAVDAGFKWAIEIADTNPVRLRINEIDQTVGSKRRALKDRQDASTKHREQLALREAEKLQLEAGQGAWNRMVASGLFADEELRNPKATGSEAARINEEATQAKVAHLVKIERLKPLQEKLQAFQSEQGDAALPGAVADIFEAHQRDAKAAYEKITSQLKDARQLVPGLRAAEKSTRERSEQLERKLSSIENEEGPASAFKAFFEGELPSDNLIKQVKDDLAKATQAQQEASIALAGLQKGLDAIEHFRAAYPDQEPGSWLEQRTKQRDWWNSELTRLKGERAEAQRKRFELETSPVAAGMVARQVMDVAGAGARPLHEVVAALNLPRDRQEAVLTLFSALLFSPVFAAEDDAVAAARKLADEHIEAPVFVEDTLAEFCRGQSISYADGIARSWMLGVRTRPVDCLIDPELVNREKAALDEHLATLDAAIQTAGNTIAELDPTGEPALLASRAKEALDEAVPEKVSALHTKLASIDGELPRLQLRASEEAIASIRSALRLAALLDDKSVDEWRALAQSTKDTAELAQGKLQVQEDLVDKLQEDQAPFGEACNLANLNALKVPDLRTLQAYVDSPDAGPQFMAAHAVIGTRLEQAAEQARRRADFDFDAANGFVIAGGAEKLTITLAAITLHVSEIEILGSEIVQLNDGITSLGDEKAGLSAPSYQLDTAVIKFRQALNDLKAIVPDPVPMTNEQLEM
ncbi:MAG: hypothetical protein JNM61_12580, partial [Zoogloeaceae bacterium]|nr:hypothetical protein [Zoogloeaceae bacterium]